MRPPSSFPLGTLALALALALSACGGLRTHVGGEDAGDGTISDGGTPGKDAGGSVDAGTADAGPGTLDGGATDAGSRGDAGRWSFAALTLPYAATVKGSLSAVQAVDGELFVLTERGAGLARRASGQWQPVVPLQNPSGDNEAMYVAPDKAIFIAGNQQIGICKSGCDSAAAFTWSRPLAPSSYFSYSAICGSSSSDVYVVGHESNPAITHLVHYNGSTFDAVDTVDVSTGGSCWLDEAGRLWIPGSTKVAIREGGAYTYETPDLSALGGQASLQQWTGVFGAGGWVHVVGYYRRTLSRSPAGVWTLVDASASTAGAAYLAVGGTADLVFAAGFYDSVQKTTVTGFADGGWAPLPDLPLLEQVRTVFVASDRELYFAGQDTAQKPGLVRATR